jgi:hypothetical protein
MPAVNNDIYEVFSLEMQIIMRPRLFHFWSGRSYLKGHSYENVCEIIALNDRLDLN